MLTTSLIVVALSKSTWIRSMLRRCASTRTSVSRTWVVTSSLCRFEETRVATFSSSVIASSKSAVGIRSTIRERSAAPSLSVSVSSSEMVPPWASTTLRTSKIAWPTSPARSCTLPVEITFCCSTPAPEVSTAGVATPLTDPSAGTSAPPAASTPSSRETSPAATLPEPPLEPLSSEEPEQLLSETRTTAAPAASAVRRKRVMDQRERRVATMATRTGTRGCGFRSLRNRYAVGMVLK